MFDPCLFCSGYDYIYLTLDCNIQGGKSMIFTINFIKSKKWYLNQQITVDNWSYSICYTTSFGVLDLT